MAHFWKSICFILSVSGHGLLHAQTLGCPPGFTEIYVDQEIGTDLISTGTPTTYPQWGCPLRPFRSITHALSQAPTASPVTIVLNPGVYSATSGETFPLVMRKNVSIQGTSALNTIILGTAVSAEKCPGTAETVATLSSLILFDAQQTGQFDQVNLDSISVIAGCIDIAITGIVPCSPTISNCFVSKGTMAGIDISSSSMALIHRPKIIHCTLAANRVAIVNRTTALLPVFPPLNAPGRPGILNILAARSTVVDFFGICSEDMNSSGVFRESSNGYDSFNSQGIPSNFNTLNPAGFSPAGTSPLFVEEFLSPSGTLSAAHDLRINPGILESGNFDLVDSAYEPAPGEVLTWDNGTVGGYSLPNGAEIGDFDCEGYGNPRIATIPPNPVYPDMGADEMGTYVLAGYVRFTTRFDLQTSNNQLIEWVGPGIATSIQQRYTFRSVPPPSVRYVDSGKPAPGNRMLKTDLPSVLPGISGTCYLDQDFINLLPFSIPATPQPMTPPRPAPAVTSRTLFNLQTVFPHLGWRLSNLQSFLVLP